MANEKEKDVAIVVGVIGAGALLMYLLRKRVDAGNGENGNGENGNGGQLYGFVMDRDTEQPVSGIYITATVEGSGIVMASTYSAADGSYSLSGLPFNETLIVSTATSADYWGWTAWIYLFPHNSPMKYDPSVTPK